MAISAEFTADFTQFTSAAQGAQEALTGVTTASEHVGGNVDKQAYAAGRAMAAFAGQVKDFATDYIKAFAEEEAATQRLTTALEASGNATPAVIAHYQAMATQFQTMTRYSDDAVTAAQTALTQIGKIGPDQMQPAIQAAADLAASLGIGLPEAATALATAIGSDGAKLGILKKYLTDTEVKGKSAAEILEMLFSKFGGAAAADMQTTNAELERFNNMLDDFKGQVGGVLATALTPLLDAFSALSPPMQTLVAGGTALVAALVPVGLALQGLMLAVGPLIPLIGTALAGAFSALLPFLGPVGLIVAGLTAVYVAFKNWDKIVEVVQSVYTAIKTWLVDKFNALLSPILGTINAVTGAFKGLYDKVVGHSYVPDMVNGISEQFKRLDAVMVQPAAAATAAVLSSFNRMSHNLMMVETDSGGIAHDAFGRPVPITGSLSALPKTMGQQNIQITVNGSVLSTEDQLAMVMGQALAGSYRRGGRRMPV